jgi:hypothetical protein
MLQKTFLVVLLFLLSWYHQREVAIMDFDLDSFFEVENIISAIFNGGPLFPDPGGAQILPATRTTQSSQDTTVTPTFTPTPVASYAPTYSLGKITTSPSSLSPQSGDDAPKQVRSKDDAPRPEIVEKTPSVYTDSLGQLFLAPGKLHLVLWMSF